MKSLVTILLLLAVVSVFGQTLMTIQNEPIPLAEFQKIYQKNNTSASSYSKKELDEYINLFTLYKMKLAEAKSLRMDTMTAIMDDYTKYTDQLARKLAGDKNYVDNIMKSQYQHMLSDVKIAHIMVRCDQNASPADTLIAYNKIKFIQSKTTPENFAEMAKENSEDKASAPNGGLLGYITAFMTAPDFEEQCYLTPVGTVSSIFRTNYGYHIIKVLDKRAARGRIKVAHIYVNNKSEEEKKSKYAETQIQKAYKELQNKVPFDKIVAKYSEDKTTIANKGELPEFGVSEMIGDFEDQAFALKTKGDYSKPFQTDYGWHIVQLIEKLPVKSYEDSKEYIRQRLERDPRIVNMAQITTQKIANQYRLYDNASVYNQYAATVSDSFFDKKNWKLSAPKSTQGSVLFSLDNQPYTVSQFVAYANQKFTATVSPKGQDLLKAMYYEYRDRMLWNHVKAKLQAENEEYRSLESEYMNGLMIFELMDKEIWKKAINDTTGSKKIYEEVKNNYTFDTRAEISSIRSSKKELIDRLHTAYNNSVLSNKEIFHKLKKTKDSNDYIYYEKVYEKGDDGEVDKQNWTAGQRFVSYDEASKMYGFNRVDKVLSPSVKPYTEIKGRIQNIYQTRLEAAYNQKLKDKYKVVLYQDVLQKIIKD